jgi:hypothetical protein
MTGARRVSVVIPTFNREALLCDTLRAVLGQDYPDTEIIVVDQSERHTAETSRFLESVATRIRHQRETCPNLPMARNTGVRLASGDIVVFIDDDVRIPPGLISMLVRHFTDPEVAGVTGYLASPTDTADEKMASFRRYVESPEALRRPGLIAVDHFFGGFMSFRRDVVQRVGGFDEWIGAQPVAAAEDLEFCMRVRNAGFRLFLDTSITVMHVGASLAAGGCDKSGLPRDVVVASQMRCLLYAHLKNAPGRGPLGWLRSIAPAYRGFVLNRQVFTADARLMWHRHVGFARALRAASRALADARGSALSRGVS